VDFFNELSYALIYLFTIHRLPSFRLAASSIKSYYINQTYSYQKEALAMECDHFVFSTPLWYHIARALERMW